MRHIYQISAEKMSYYESKNANGVWFCCLKLQGTMIILKIELENKQKGNKSKKQTRSQYLFISSRSWWRLLFICYTHWSWSKLLMISLDNSSWCSFLISCNPWSCWKLKDVVREKDVFVFITMTNIFDCYRPCAALTDSRINDSTSTDIVPGTAHLHRI